MALMTTQFKPAIMIGGAVANKVISQSAGLRARHIKMHEEGKHLMLDANESEATLNDAMASIQDYAKAKIEALGAKMEYSTKCTLFDCQIQYHASGGPLPDPSNKGVSMRPDGGIIWAVLASGKRYPVFIGEDKVQGTNDTRKAEGKPRQATGNAIERAAKNIRGCEMICPHMSTFPYVIFASGCDFHHTETISKRLEMMNMGIANHYMEVSPTSTPESLDARVDEIVGNINPRKMSGIGIASVFVKSHKWDEMCHGASRWRKKEIIAFSCRVIDQTMDSIDWEQHTNVEEDDLDSLVQGMDV